MEQKDFLFWGNWRRILFSAISSRLSRSWTIESGILSGNVSLEVRVLEGQTVLLVLRLLAFEYTNNIGIVNLLAIVAQGTLRFISRGISRGDWAKKGGNVLDLYIVMNESSTLKNCTERIEEGTNSIQILLGNTGNSHLVNELTKKNIPKLWNPTLPFGCPLSWIHLS